ncbi:aspartate dehydrogenase, partial [bacterium]
MIRIGLIGCGNIGHIIAKYQDKFEILALFDIVPEKSRELADICGGIAYDDFGAFISSEFDIVVEAASLKAVRLFGEEVLSHNKDMVIMSVGALADKTFLALLTD